MRETLPFDSQQVTECCRAIWEGGIYEYIHLHIIMIQVLYHGLAAVVASAEFLHHNFVR